MAENMNLNDLPDEVLCLIFDKLDVYELKLASLVCLRWSELTFSGRRMDRVCLVTRDPWTLDSNSDFLFNTKRKYRNVRQNYQLKSLVRLLHMLKPYVRELHIECHVTSEQLRLLLLEAPELQHLEIDGLIKRCETNGPFPVLAKLKKLVLKQKIEEQLDFFRKSTSNLQSLYMNCIVDFELQAWKCLSGQLKVVHVNGFYKQYLHPFLELTFPLLEHFTVEGVYRDMEEIMILKTDNDFFKRHPLLQRLSFDPAIRLKLIKSITRHCPELTYLHLVLQDPKEGHLESLVQLTKLKHLSLEGIVKRKMFRGAFKLLESVVLNISDPGVLLENLFEVAPRLTDMTLQTGNSYELQFVCEKFSCLQHLKVNMVNVVACDNSLRFDKLTHLQELKLSSLRRIKNIRSNNVQCLTISDYMLRRSIVIGIPEKFPLLKRLSLDDCNSDLHVWTFVDGAILLQELMPSCRIDFGDERFYPVDNSTSN